MLNYKFNANQIVALPLIEGDFYDYADLKDGASLFEVYDFEQHRNFEK